jgi:hypothetical protein
VAALAGQVDEGGRRLVVRNGRCRFRSSILPPWARKLGLGGVDACGEVEQSLRQFAGGLHCGVVAHAVE